MASHDLGRLSAADRRRRLPDRRTNGWLQLDGIPLNTRLDSVPSGEVPGSGAATLSSVITRLCFHCRVAGVIQERSLEGPWQVAEARCSVLRMTDGETWGSSPSRGHLAGRSGPLDWDWSQWILLGFCSSRAAAWSRINVTFPIPGFPLIVASIRQYRREPGLERAN